MTGKDKILLKMEDMQWHTTNELIGVYYKFSSRMSDLRKQGYVFETRENAHNKHAFDYRLVKFPSEHHKPRFSESRKTIDLSGLNTAPKEPNEKQPMFLL